VDGGRFLAQVFPQVSSRGPEVDYVLEGHRGYYGLWVRGVKLDVSEP
jgi:hypothetical protein